jgi:hypothetical protein
MALHLHTVFVALYIDLCIQGSLDFSRNLFEAKSAHCNVVCDIGTRSVFETRLDIFQPITPYVLPLSI